MVLYKEERDCQAVWQLKERRTVMQIYVDNAATTKMSDKAIEAMIPYMKEIYGIHQAYIQ